MSGVYGGIIIQRKGFTVQGPFAPSKYLSHCQRCCSEYGAHDYVALSRKELEHMIDQETRALCDEGGLDFANITDRVAAQRAVFQNNRALRVAWASR